jgi:hypothetical protein
MSELSPGAKALFKEARAGFEPTSGQKKRVYGAVIGSTAPAIATAAAASKVGAAAGITGASWIKIAGLSLLIGGAGTSLAFLARTPRSTAPVLALAPSAAIAPTSPGTPVDLGGATDEGVPPHDEAIQPRPATVPGPMAPRPRASREAIPETDTLEDEVRAMHDARQALNQGKPELALSLAGDYVSRYPRGVLREEEMAIRALALCRLGRTSEATIVADRLEKIAPRSPQLARIRMSCVGKAP